MVEQTPSNAVKAAEGLPRGDLGRRVAGRRAQLGLTRGETAARAGMAPDYLRHLEEHPDAAPDAGALRRLAGALETTVSELTGGNVELPPGGGQAARQPKFTELSTAECWELLSTHGVGRLGVPADSGPVIVPVNYSVIDAAIVFRTTSGATPSQASESMTAFEVDRIDDAFSQGWSVLVRGHAQVVIDPEAVRHLEKRAYSTPWAGGRRDLWVRIAPQEITGRRITV
ncbi:pyridoxamine 5'-phosphate oxidase family protein [Streptomyces sp. NPDC021056]|uniref:helix-turn-helix domain-containing protein n=1 Tax=Streptomyces sp. NPDC021056 TaxID=3155012 RepID=UPI0033C8710F